MIQQENTIVTLEDPGWDYKRVAKMGEGKYFYLAKLSNESFVELWQACDDIEQFKASYEAMGGGTCRLTHEEETPIPVESVHKIRYTLDVLRKKGVNLKGYDTNHPEEEEYWDNLRRLANAKQRRAAPRT